MSVEHARRVAPALAGATRPLRSGEMARALGSIRRYLLAAAAFGAAVNLLHLAPALYMMQIYDRVIPSGSGTTLALLTLVLLSALLTIGLLDNVRARILVRAGLVLDDRLAAHVFEASVHAHGDQRCEALKSFESIRMFASGSGMQALFDLLWFPIYTLVLGLLHPALAVFALVCAFSIGIIALAQEYVTRRSLGRGNECLAESMHAVEAGNRAAASMVSMGFLSAFVADWRTKRNFGLVEHQRATEVAAAFQALAKSTRVAMQSLVLGLGAWLVIEQSLGAGVMFAASLLLGRALQPIEQTAASLRALQSAREAWVRLDGLLQPRAAFVAMPFNPTAGLSVESVGYMLPTAARPILYNINLEVSRGEIVAIVGPSGSGKSILAGLIAGAFNPSMGAIRLGGMPLAGRPEIGRLIGFLSDAPNLLPGTISANISRFHSAEPVEIVAAARIAGAHESILRLPQGYETHVTEMPGLLSAGLCQRIALARALYGSPQLVVLDGPEARLDSTTEALLPQLMLGLKARGACTIVLSHRPAILAVSDRVVVMRGGTVAVQGPLRQVLQGAPPPVVRLERRA